MSPTYDFDGVIRQMEADRASGRLSDALAQGSWVRYGTVDDAGRIEAVDRLGRTWDHQLEERIRERIQEMPPGATIRLSEQPEHLGQAHALEGVFEWLLRDGTLLHHCDDCFYRP